MSDKEKERNARKAEIKKELIRFQDSVAVQLKKMKAKIEEAEKKLEE